VSLGEKKGGKGEGIEEKEGKILGVFVRKFSLRSRGVGVCFARATQTSTGSGNHSPEQGRPLCGRRGVVADGPEVARGAHHVVRGDLDRRPTTHDGRSLRPSTADVAVRLTTARDRDAPLVSGAARRLRERLPELGGQQRRRDLPYEGGSVRKIGVRGDWSLPFL